MNYEISFLEPKAYRNWVSVSSISKEVFLGFIDYLYSLDRDIEVLPYIKCEMFTESNTDKTYLVKRIARIIKDKCPKEDIFEEFTYIPEDDNEAHVYFIEDIYEMLLSFGLTQEFAVDIARSHYCNDELDRQIPIAVNSERLKTLITQLEGSGYFPYHSRWMFIYMFRGEFVRYMKSKGYDDVSVEGGWVLNDKEREIELGLIDTNRKMIK